MIQIRPRPVSERHVQRRVARQRLALNPAAVLLKAVLGGVSGLGLGYVIVELLSGTTPAELLQRAEQSVLALEAWLR